MSKKGILAAGEKLSVKELFEQQTSRGTLATLRPVPDDPGIVVVTPYNPGSGCLCALSYSLSDSCISAVYATGVTTVCCGNMLNVVSVEFKATATVKVEEMFKKLSSIAATMASMGQEHSEHHERMVPAETYGARKTCPHGQYACCCGPNDCKCCGKPCNYQPCTPGSWWC